MDCVADVMPLRRWASAINAQLFFDQARELGAEVVGQVEDLLEAPMVVEGEDVDLSE
jgi:hypothetical protein